MSTETMITQTTPVECMAFGGGRYQPAMFARADEELSHREMRMIAASHGYEMRTTITEVDPDIVFTGDFAKMLEEVSPATELDGGWHLSGVWDSEDGEVIACYLRAKAPPHADSIAS